MGIGDFVSRVRASQVGAARRAAGRHRVSSLLPNSARASAMSEPHSGRPRRGGDAPAPATPRRSLFHKFVEFVAPGPDSRDELIESLAEAEQRELIPPESRMMLEGVIRMADMTAGDAMVAAPRMDLLDIDAPYDELLAVVIDTGHSRFPVYEDKRENVIGILMAKDLLKLQRAPEQLRRGSRRPRVSRTGATRRACGSTCTPCSSRRWRET